MFDYARLEQLISASGKTKAHLCKKLGRPSYYLRDVIKQKTSVPDELQEILAEELGTTVSYLNGGPKNEKSPAPEGAELDPVTQELFDIVNSSDEDELKTLLEMARLLKKRRN